MQLPWHRTEREMEQELAHHLHHLAAEYEQQGYSREEARRMAKRTLGGSEQIKEECRDESRWATFTGFLQDLRFGARSMSRTPVVTLAAVLSLALGIGANTAIVSLMDVVLWRDLPLPAPKQLALINWQGHNVPHDLMDGGAGSMWDEEGISVADFFSYPAFEAIRKGVAERASVAAYSFPDTVSLSFAGYATVAQQRPVSGNFFSTLKVRPALGRVFTESDDQDAAPATAILSHELWASSFHSDPTVIGKTVIVNNEAQVIVGVLDSSFFGLSPGDSTRIYAPLHHGAWQEAAAPRMSLNNNRAWTCSMVLRRRPGVTDAQLLPGLQTLFHLSLSRPPKDPAQAPRLRLDGGSRGLGFLRRDFRNSLLILGAFVGLLLFIACTNIVNLLLARAIARQREISVRISLGCSRARLVRQFVTESALLATVGGILSVGVGFGTANLLGRFLAERDGLPITVSLDGRVLLIAGAITTIALLLFGVFPAFRGSRDSRVSLNRQGMGGFGDRSEHRWSTGRILVVAQVAMSVLLVMAAVIFTRNLLAIHASDPGFDRRNLALFNIRPGTSGYEKKRLRSFYFNVEQQLRATPGVMAVGMAAMRPMNVGGWWESIRLTGGITINNASINGITPGYLPLYIPRLIAGRNITRADIESNAKVAIISEDLAQKLGRDKVLGNTLEFTDGPPGAPHPQFQVVGVAPAIAATSMKDRPAAVWLPLDKEPAEVTVVLRTLARPQVALPAIQRTMTAIDRNLPLVDVTTMEEQMAKGLERERMFALLCTAFGGLALLLSTVGLYGVISFSTSRRRGEIGVRLALGAMPHDVLSMVLREGLALTVLGILAAAPIVALGAGYLEKSLSKMKPLEPTSIFAALIVLLTAALIAVGLPAFRASVVDPAETLRQE